VRYEERDRERERGRERDPWYPKFRSYVSAVWRAGVERPLAGTYGKKGVRSAMRNGAGSGAKGRESGMRRAERRWRLRTGLGGRVRARGWLSREGKASKAMFGGAIMK